MKEFPLEERRTWVIALMIECPLGEALDGCPATGVRGLPLAEIVELVGELREEDLNRIIRHHRQCLDARERARDGGAKYTGAVANLDISPINRRGRRGSGEHNG